MNEIRNVSRKSFAFSRDFSANNSGKYLLSLGESLDRQKFDFIWILHGIGTNAMDDVRKSLSVE